MRLAALCLAALAVADALSAPAAGTETPDVCVSLDEASKAIADIGSAIAEADSKEQVAAAQEELNAMTSAQQVDEEVFMRKLAPHCALVSSLRPGNHTLGVRLKPDSPPNLRIEMYAVAWW